jgi:SAM-dependent methyltransferase
MSSQSHHTDIKEYLRNLRPRIAEDVETFEDEGGALLYHPSSTHAVVLNPSALVIMELCDGERTTFEIAKLLSEETGEDSAEIFSAVVDTLMKLRGKRIVDIDGLTRLREFEEDPTGSTEFWKDRLDFRLPEFTRMSWVDESAKAVWADRIQRIQQAWQEIEWRSVSKGVRKCALISATPEYLVELSERLLETGLVVLPVAVHDGSRPYASSTTAPKQGQPVCHRVVVGIAEDTLRLKKAMEASDNETVGRLLGYPSCCRQFFEQTWVQQSLVDTTWPMALNGTVRDQVDPDGRSIDISSKAPYQTNILWRWMGVRAVPHLPCSFQCAETVTFANKLLDVGREAGFVEEFDWMKQILSWPVEWSALHGIAEIRTPILKVSTRTDATAHKFVLRKRGVDYPAEGASGLSFPYQTRQKDREGRTRRAEKEAPDDVVTEPDSAYPWLATDNGFESVVAMRTAHAPIIDLASRTISREGASVVDLGCGNGALLKAILSQCPQMIPFGIDSDPEKAEHAKILLPGFSANIITGDMFENIDLLFDDDTHYTLALLMPGRLLEVDAASAGALRDRLARQTGSVLLYAYGSWLTRFGGLGGLAAECGIPVPESSSERPAAIVDASVFRAAESRLLL